MAEVDHCTEITVYFLDGRNESYTIYDSVAAPGGGQTQRFAARIPEMLQQPWWILHLAEQTVMLNLSNVIKIEVRPGVPHLQGDSVLGNVDRATALRQGRKIFALPDD
ncbi:MAG: hypothetical protein AAF289_02100 [Cyanobacteria bacterium P01_A01_bin.135]